MSLECIADNSLLKDSIFRRVNDSAEVDPTKFNPFDHIIAATHAKILKTYPWITTGLNFIKNRGARDGLVIVCIQDKDNNKCSSTCTFRVRASYVNKDCKLTC
jgi:hypothetical protein